MTGISHAYGGALSALSVEYTLTPITGAGQKRWKEMEIVKAIYEGRHDILVDEEQVITGDF
jgi:hypothetical protein